VLDTRDSKDSNKNMDKVLYVSLAFLVMFTAQSAANSLASQIYEDLGFAALGKLNNLILS